MLSSTSKPYRTRYFRRPYPRVLFYTWELTCGLFYIDVLCNKHTGSLGVLVTVHPPHQPRTEGVQPQSEMYGAPPCCPCARCFARVGSLLSRHLAGVGRLGARCWRKKIAIALLRYFSLSPQQVDLWVRVGGTPSPHIHTYILQDQAGPWCTQLQILDLPVLELNPLNFHLFLIFHQPKGCFPPDRQKVPKFTL